MSRIKVTFEVKVPVDANYEETLQWVKFQVGAIGGIKQENPLAIYDIDATFGTVQIEEI
jgi:hypothetical protein